jgi:hypothetical protein
MVDRIIPRCCGSEDGDIIYGTDLTTKIDTLVEMWACHTCGALTVLSDYQLVVSIQPTDRH